MTGCRIQALGSLEREEPAASGAAELVRSLRGELGCAICSDLILDAGILPCSHGFCYKVTHPPRTPFHSQACRAR